MNAAGCTHTYTLNLTINLSTTSTETVTACNSYTWPVNGVTYTTSGTKTATSTNAAGCTHTSTLNLTINLSTSNTTTASACSSYTWSVNGTTYTTSGTRVVTSTNAAGCSHTETLVLTIRQPSSSTANVSICDGASYSLPSGAVVSTSGTYVSHILNAAGCDSAITTNLTVLSPVVVTVVPGTIACYGGTTSAVVSATGGSGVYSGTGTITGFTMGNKIVYVTDSKGCVGSASFTLTQPAKVNVTTTSNPADCGQNNGNATATVSGGTSPYTDLWSNGKTYSYNDSLVAGTYTISVTDANGCVGTSSVTVGGAIGSVVTAPGAITGLAGACKGQTGVVYCIDAVVGATSYAWTLPTGATGTSTGTCITVSFSTKYAGGYICVRAVSPCGTSLSSCMNIPVLTTTPAKPGLISGVNPVCSNTLPAQYTYCVAAVPYATSYIWTVSGSASSPLTIVSGLGTNCVTVNVPAGYNGAQKLNVKATSCKGTSSTRSLQIMIQSGPSQPGSISGSGSVCKNSTSSYSISSVSGATSYTWSVTGGAIILSGQGSTSVSIKFNTATSSSAVVSVVANNSCGDASVARTKSVSVNLSCRVSSNGTLEPTETVNSTTESLNAYPNPTSGKATVTFNADRNANYSLKVIDLIGRVMITENIAAVEGYNTKEISLENVSKGIYFISVQTEGGEAQTMRLIVE